MAFGHSVSDGCLLSFKWGCLQVISVPGQGGNKIRKVDAGGLNMLGSMSSCGLVGIGISLLEYVCHYGGG